jgi:hypothetical protein
VCWAYTHIGKQKCEICVLCGCMGMGRGGSEHCWKVTSGGSAEHVSSVAKPRRGGVALEKRPSTRKYDTGCRGEENRNFSRKVWSLYKGLSSRTLMSKSHCSKSSACTRAIPGGRLPLICDKSDHTLAFIMLFFLDRTLLSSFPRRFVANAMSPFVVAF